MCYCKCSTSLNGSGIVFVIATVTLITLIDMVLGSVIIKATSNFEALNTFQALHSKQK